MRKEGSPGLWGVLCGDGGWGIVSVTLEVAQEVVHKLPRGVVDEQLALDLAVRVENRGVIAATEPPRDRR